jgi:hypothetical protein
VKTAHFLVLGVLCVSPMLFGQSAGSKQQAKPKVNPEQTQPGSPSPARMVYLDPETGLFRPAESTDATRQPAGQARIAAPAIIRLPQGGVARRTPLSEMQFSVVQRNEDGSLSYSCQRGLPTAEELVRKAAAARAIRGGKR